MEFDVNSQSDRRALGALEINLLSRARERELAKTIAGMQDKHGPQEPSEKSRSKSLLTQLLSSVRIF